LNQIPFWEYMFMRWDRILELTIEHIELVVIAVAIAIVMGIVLGLLSTYSRSLAQIIIPFTQIMMTVPSIALMALLIPLLSIGFTNAMVALIIYSLLPIVNNTYTGIRQISPSIIEAARGMGLTEWRILAKIKIPLALPVIVAGIRTASIMIIGIGAIASYIGAGGLGELIFHGIARSNGNMIIAGAIVVSLLAVIADFGLRYVERRLLSRQV